MKRFMIIAAFSLLMSSISIQLHANMMIDQSRVRVKIYQTKALNEGWEAVIKGKISSISSMDEMDENDLLGRAKDKYKATVRLFSTEGIKAGDILYVINSNNLIVARLTVKNIFKTNSFGHMLVGHGNFRLVGNDYMVAQRAEDNISKDAYIYKSRGDYFVNIGEEGKAISEYKKSIALDKGNPEARLALGYIYMKQGVDRFAYTEFQEAYKRIARLYDNEDKYMLFKGLTELIYREVYETSNLNTAMKKKFINDGILYCTEGLKIYPKSVDMNYYMAMFHYKGPEPDHKTAREYFLKVIELKPDHSGSYIALSNLYFLHKNKDKAKMYIDKVLEFDKFNPEARDMLNKIETFNIDK